MPVLPCQRDLFEIPDHVAYFDCAKMSPLLKAAQAQGSAGLARKLAPWDIKAAHFFDETERVRAQAARLVGARADDMAFVPSVSYGLAAAAANLPVEAGQEIVLLAEDFPSVALTAMALARRAGATVRTVGRGPVGWTVPLLDAIGPRTAIVFTPHTHWSDGGLVDLVAVGAACRAAGAALVLDLTQSLGALPVDVAAIDPDFLVAASYKWLFGPYGTGILYVAPRWQEGVPLEQGWAVRRGAEDFRRLVPYQEAFAPGARRFDMGERCNFALLPPLEAAIEWLLGNGIAAIAETLGAKTAALAVRLAPLGITPPAGAQASHFLSVARDGGWPEDLGERLAAQNVHVSLRGEHMRITPHLYNNQADADRLIKALAAV